MVYLTCPETKTTDMRGPIIYMRNSMRKTTDSNIIYWLKARGFSPEKWEDDCGNDTGTGRTAVYFNMPDCLWEEAEEAFNVKYFNKEILTW